jgi:two-component system NtrC family sensor kinase
MRSILLYLHNMGIRTKLIVAYSSMFIILIVLIHTVIYILLKQTIERNIEAELETTSILIRDMVESSADLSIKNHLSAMCHVNKGVVQYYYDLFLQGKLTEQQAKDQAAKVLLTQKIGKTGYIYCLNSQGILQVHPEMLGEDVSNHTHVQIQIARKEGYLEYDWKNPGEESPRPKALHMTYFQPWDWIISASSYRSEFKNLVNVNDFKDRINNIVIGETGYSFVINSQGDAIIHPALEGFSLLEYQDSDGLFFIQEMCKNKNGQIIYPWKNPNEVFPRNKLVVYYYIPQLDWIVASSSYIEEFYRPLMFLRYILLGSVIFALLVILPLSMILGSHILKPLYIAIYKLTHVKEGDYSVRLPIHSADEIGQLSKCFNTYMDSLQRYSDQLGELNTNLEERTAKLTEALTKVKTLSGMLPICAKCKKIRNDEGYWEQIETYIENSSDALFSHGLCEDCAHELYGQSQWYTGSQDLQEPPINP